MIIKLHDDYINIDAIAAVRENIPAGTEAGVVIGDHNLEVFFIGGHRVVIENKQSIKYIKQKLDGITE